MLRIINKFMQRSQEKRVMLQIQRKMEYLNLCLLKLVQIILLQDLQAQI
jgi:hypothetical protein